MAPGADVRSIVGAPACKASSADSDADGYRPRLPGLAGESDQPIATPAGDDPVGSEAAVGEAWGGSPAYRDDGSQDYSSLTVARIRGYVVYRPTGEVLSSVIADVQRERMERKDDDPRSERGPSTEARAPTPVVSGDEPFG
jgi:hypothetical protein